MNNPARPPCHVTGTAFITGGGSGIGKCIASVYAQNGIQGLALADVNITNLQNVQAKLSNQYPDVSVEIFSVNVTDEKKIAAAVQFAAAKFARLDISIQAAGITGAVAPTHEYPLEDNGCVIDPTPLVAANLLSKDSL